MESFESEINLAKLEINGHWNFKKNMIKSPRIPDGFKKLLAYQKAEAIQAECSRLTEFFPKTKTSVALADQMNRSARSGKQNIVEGWKRNSTKEYYEFLGFSMGANKELEEDCNDIWKGFYPDLMGLKGVRGKRLVEKQGQYDDKRNGGFSGDKMEEIF